MSYLARILSDLLGSLFKDNQNYHVEQLAEEKDWTWETPDAIQQEKSTIIGTVDSLGDLDRVFKHICGVFDRGFEEPQVAVLRNVAGKLKLNESRNFIYQTRRNGKLTPLKVTIECQRIDFYKIWIETEKSAAGSALPRIGAPGFEIEEN